MAIRVLFFSFAAERMKERQVDLDDAAGSRVIEVFHRFENRLGAPRDRFLFSVNDEWADEDRVLQDGDALAIIPPMSGG